jgi:hypothetical protein
VSNVNLGFFRDFKGADSVLLDGTSEDIALLSTRLGEFMVSTEPLLAIHDIATVSSRHPVQLFASRSAHTSSPGFLWLCSPTDFDSIQGMLEPLANSRSGHQYFTLVNSPAHLVVSVGEYGDAWWRAHG